MAQSNLVKKVAIKNEQGTIGTPYNIGADFADVVDSRSNKGNYSLQQFFDNYLDYMTNADFIYYGVSKPTNPKIRLWINTSETQN